MSQMIPEQGPPPALLQALQASAGPAVPREPNDAGGDEREPIQILKQMIALAQRYIQVEPDAEDKATMAKVQMTLHQYLAKEQQDAEAALGGGAPTRLLRRLGSA